jgi:hypothetical protein
MLLTARHVVEDSIAGPLWFFPRPPGTLERRQLGDVVDTRSGPVFERVRIPLLCAHVSDSSDLAALEVERAGGTFANVRFFEGLPDSRSPEVGGTVFFQGFPAALGKIVAPGALAVLRRAEIRQVQPPAEIPGHDSGSSFLLDYFEDTGGIAPYGFSGAGVWFRSGKTDVWHPNLILGGVVTNFFPKRKLLEVERVEQVQSFLGGIAT